MDDDKMAEITGRAKKTRREAVEIGARVEAQWDGRDYDGLSRTEKQRYMDRFEAAMDACNEHIIGQAAHILTGFTRGETH